jgi:plasmid stabilization system protein ParE
LIRIGWHPLAKRELFDSSDFYQRKAAGLGEVFLDIIEAAVARIRRHLQVGSPILDEIRRVSVSKFRYSVVYRIEEKRVFILAIAHESRRPLYWARRARD